jgi:cytochrome c oxidase subunit 2
MRRSGWALPQALLVGGCSGSQSVLAPEAEGAHQIAHLSWILFGLCSAIFLFVIVAALLAMRGPTKIRAILADPSAVVVGGILFPVVILTSLLFYSVWLLRADAHGFPAKPALRIHVSGEQWWWRVTYSRFDNDSIASANEIRIPVDAEVEFILNSADVIHSFWIPSLGGKVDMIPGRSTRMRVTAQRAGIYRGQCAEYCGGPHAFMAITVIAMPRREFDEWLKAEAAPAVKPASGLPSRGHALFDAAGCGSCHTVRGTGASGVVGPDLSRIGSRRSLGAELLPMSKENLARFIVDGQQLKPGNRMPPFRIFRREDLDALTTYLAGLR